MKLNVPALLLLGIAAAAAPAPKPRLVVLTDIGGDPDDRQSMVRLMTYANEFAIEGLIASAAGTPGELKGDMVRPELIREIVAAYARVRSNLLRHAPGYPAADALQKVVKAGNPRRGVGQIGEGHDTEGSRWIIAVVDRDDPRPVNVAVWGGATDLAQALWRVRRDRSPADAARFVSRLRVHSIEHQDDTGPWIVEQFPDLFFILSSSAGGEAMAPRAKAKVDRRLSVYRGMYLGGDESLTSRQWVEGHVRSGHGPLGALYPDKTWTVPNPHGVLKEGDTPSWFYFLPHGLNDPEHPEWGGWGGRFRLVRNRYYNDARDRVGEVEDARATVWRWREAFQNDFAARMDWCVAPRREAANHNPVAVLNGDRGRAVLRVTAEPGSRVRLSAAGSHDPDGHRLAYRWFQYEEAGEAGARVDLKGATGETVVFTAPPAAAHIILEIRDNGVPPLSAWRRAVVEPRPAAIRAKARPRR